MKKHGGWGGPLHLTALRSAQDSVAHLFFFSTTYAVPILQILYFEELPCNGERGPMFPDRKSTRLNSSHSQISYAVFCLKKKTSVRYATRNCLMSGDLDPPCRSNPPSIATPLTPILISETSTVSRTSQRTGINFILLHRR